MMDKLGIYLRATSLFKSHSEYLEDCNGIEIFARQRGSSKPESQNSERVSLPAFHASISGYLCADSCWLIPEIDFWAFKQGLNQVKYWGNS